MAEPVTAAVLVIGDEILSGRTQDTNSAHIARWLGEIGIGLCEIRVVPDVQAEIVAAIDALRTRYTYVFTTGGIGPTHDDITADAVAAAFGCGISPHPEALRILEARYKPGEFNEARRRMARIPHGAALIDNPVSGAPGFQIGNVFVMAGVPVVMQAMLESVRPRLSGGDRVGVRNVSADRVGEGLLAGPLGALAAAHPEVKIGSYPYYRPGGSYGVTLVLRSADLGALDLCEHAVQAMVDGLRDTPPA